MDQEDQVNPELNEDLLSFQAVSLQVQIDSFDRESLMIKREDDERRSLIDKLEDLGYEYHLKQIIGNLLTIYMELQFNASELTKLFGLQDQYTRLTIQLSRLCMIGTLQIQQLIENTFDSEILGSFSLQKGFRNTDAMKTLFEYQDKHILPQLLEICNEFFNKKKKQTIIQLTTEFRFQMAKLLSTLEFMPFAAVVKQDDIMFKLKVSKRWENLMKHVVVRVLGTPEQLKKSKDNVINAIQSAQAMLQKKDEAVWFKDVIHNFGSLYFMIAKKHQKQKAHLFIAETKNELAFAVWNLGESGMMKKMMPVMFQPITFKKKIYIPRLFKHIDLEWFQNMQGDKIADPNQPFLKDKPQLETLIELTKKNLTSERVKIRILCSSKLTSMPQDKQIEKRDYSVAPKWIKNLLTGKEQEGIYTDVILHIHGGGFVSMSSRSHQNYTRKWANQINVPIFSLDYRLSPQNQFPDALDDCWQAYLWILHFSPHYFSNFLSLQDIIPRRIILVGDSAGGNLVASLTNLCIKQNVQIPYAQLLIYPALDINLHNFTPSRIVALDDSLLPHTFLKLCIQSYVQTEQNMNDPLISPINATQEMIKKYPITRIMTGTDDPLHDDNWRLLEKLIQENIDCQLYLYPDMPHGLISFDPLMPQCAQCVEDAKQILVNILQK